MNLTQVTQRTAPCPLTAPGQRPDVAAHGVSRALPDSFVHPELLQPGPRPRTRAIPMTDSYLMPPLGSTNLQQMTDKPRETRRKDHMDARREHKGPW